MMDWICEKAVADQPENLASLAVALLGPKATRSAKDYATWDLPEEVKKAHAALEPLGKALLPKEGEDDGQEEAEDQADWEALLKKHSTSSDEELVVALGSEKFTSAEGELSPDEIVPVVFDS